MHHGVVNCAGIEEKFSSDLLKEFYFRRCEVRAVINLCILDVLFIVGPVHFGWSVVFCFGISWLNVLRACSMYPSILTQTVCLVYSH